MAELDDLLGRRIRLQIRALEPSGAWLVEPPVPGRPDDPGAPAILLPGRELPPDAKVGDALVVFVHLDSQDRIAATTRTPKLELGEVRFLEVTAVTDIGAFVNWGLGKELLVPFAEQSRDVFEGETHPIGLYLDKTGRLAGTMLVSDVLGEPPDGIAHDVWIEGEAWRNDPEIGLFAILDRRYVGLVPASEPHRLHRGDAAKFRVTTVLPDGKLVLSLRQHAHKELETDARIVLAAITRADAPRLGEYLDPDTIRDLVGLSKKAFKRAVGRLLKQGAVRIDERGDVVAVAPPVAVATPPAR